MLVPAQCQSLRKENKMSEEYKKQRYSVWLSKDAVQKSDAAVVMEGLTNRSDFIEKAIHLNGIEYIRDKTVNVEDTVIEKLICQKAMQAVENYDKHGILQLFLLGFTETEIARKIGVSQAYVNQTKNKLRKKIQTYMENDICN